MMPDGLIQYHWVRPGWGWRFQPGATDPCVIAGSRLGVSSDEVYKTEQSAIRAGRRWMRECGRIGEITADYHGWRND